MQSITTSTAPTMSSRDLLKMVNASRAEAGEKSIRANDFHARIDDELEGQFYETFVKPSGKSGGRPSKEYMLTQDQCVLVGMRESKSVRRSVLEKLKAGDRKHAEKLEHAASRNTARLEAPALTDAVKYRREADGKAVNHYHFSNEFDLVNRIAIGMTSKHYREAHGLGPKDPIRDHVTALEIKCIEHLQRVNASLIDIGMEFADRKVRLSQIYAQRHAAGLIREVKAIES